MASLLGTSLRLAREQRGMSVLDAAHATRIPAQRLEWLENDNYAAFGSLTYARSFLKIYSGFLQVDAAEILAALPVGRLGGVHSYGYLTGKHGSWIALKRCSKRNLQTFGEKTSVRSPVPAGIAIFLLMLVGTGIWGSHVAQHRQLEPILLTAPAQAKGMPKALMETKEIISVHTNPELPLKGKALKTNPIVRRLPSTFEAGMIDRVQ